MEFVVVEMDELIRLYQSLWVITNYHTHILNGDEYMIQFSRSTETKTPRKLYHLFFSNQKMSMIAYGQP
jgi:hypothetical protein